MKNYIKPFRYWCQQALPLTFDDSISYMELLSKMTNYINDCIHDVATAETDIENLANAYNQLQNYVNTYFDDLDVQEEVNNALDAMVESGEFGELLTPVVAAQIGNVVAEQLPDVVGAQIGDAVANQIDDVVEEQLPDVVDDQIAGAVSDWMGQNVSPIGATVIVDRSLTIAGAAADAKVVGDKFGILFDTNKQNLAIAMYARPYEIEGDYTADANGNNLIPFNPLVNGASFTVDSDKMYLMYVRGKFESDDTCGTEDRISVSLFNTGTTTRAGVNNSVNPISKSQTHGEEANWASRWTKFDETGDVSVDLGFLLSHGQQAAGNSYHIHITITDYAIVEVADQAESNVWINANVPAIGENYQSLYFGEVALNDELLADSCVIRINPSTGQFYVSA